MQLGVRTTVLKWLRRLRHSVSGWQHVQKIHVPNWFPTVSDWFRLVSRHLFWGLCWKSTVNLGWSLEEYVRGHQFWTCWFVHILNLRVLRILTSKLQKVLGLSCQPTKVVISKQNFQIPGESHGLSDFSRMIWVSICHLPLCPADLWPWASVQAPKCWKMLKNTTPPRGLREESKLNRLNTFIRQTGLTRQLSSDPRLRTVSFRGGQVCKGLTVSRLDQHVPLTALDPLYPLFLSVVYLFFVFICFYLCLSVFSLAVFICFCLCLSVFSLAVFICCWSVVYLLFICFLGYPWWHLTIEMYPLTHVLLGAFGEHCLMPANISLPFFLGRHRPGCPPKTAAPIGGASTSASRFSRTGTCTKLPGTVSV